jgi:hypothetical protein
MRAAGLASPPRSWPACPVSSSYPQRSNRVTVAASSATGQSPRWRGALPANASTFGCRRIRLHPRTREPRAQRTAVAPLARRRRCVEACEAHEHPARAVAPSHAAAHHYEPARVTESDARAQRTEAKRWEVVRLHGTSGLARRCSSGGQCRGRCHVQIIAATVSATTTHSAAVSFTTQFQSTQPPTLHRLRAGVRAPGCSLSTAHRAASLRTTSARSW